MLLNKDTYEEYCNLLQEENYIELERKIETLNDALITTYIQDYLDNDHERMKRDLKNSTRYKKILFSNIKDRLSYQIGAFNAILTIFEILVYKKIKNEDFTQKIKSLFNKKNYSNVLLFLYKNPDSQHKVILDNTGLKANYLSEILKELEKEECVHRYAAGKRSFFTLSNKAQNYIRENVKTTNTIHRSNYNEYLKYDVAGNERTTFPIKDKYSPSKIQKLM